MTTTLPIDLTISKELLSDLLVTAVEGGSGYWADFSEIRRTKTADIVSVRVTESDPSTDGPPTTRTVTPAILMEGLRYLALAAKSGVAADGSRFPAAADHLSDLLHDNSDAITADVVLQLTLFKGTVVYG